MLAGRAPAGGLLVEEVPDRIATIVARFAGCIGAEAVLPGSVPTGCH